MFYWGGGFFPLVLLNCHNLNNNSNAASSFSGHINHRALGCWRSWHLVAYLNIFLKFTFANLIPNVTTLSTRALWVVFRSQIPERLGPLTFYFLTLRTQHLRCLLGIRDQPSAGNCTHYYFIWHSASTMNHKFMFLKINSPVCSVLL